MVPGMGNLSYEERLEAMDLPSLAYRRLRGMQLRHYRVDSSSMLPLAGPNRSASTKNITYYFSTMVA